MPVVAAAHWLDIDEPTMLRAVTLSNLIAIRIKSKFGRLSNLCGATVAGTGAACGITYLLGGEMCIRDSIVACHDDEDDLDEGGQLVGDHAMCIRDRNTASPSAATSTSTAARAS